MRRLLMLVLIIMMPCIVSCGGSGMKAVFHHQAAGLSGELEFAYRGIETGLFLIVEEIGAR